MTVPETDDTATVPTTVAFKFAAVVCATVTGLVTVARVPMFQVPDWVAATVPLTVTVPVTPTLHEPDWVAATVHEPLCVAATVPDTVMLPLVTVTLGVFWTRTLTCPLASEAMLRKVVPSDAPTSTGWIVVGVTKVGEAMGDPAA